jgi:hypothetical protein
VQSLAQLMILGYPERVAQIHVGPVNLVVKSVHRLLRPLLPAAVKSKIFLMEKPAADLVRVMPARHIPSFFGGAAELPFLTTAERADGRDGKDGKDGGGGVSFDMQRMEEHQAALLATLTPTLATEAAST